MKLYILRHGVTDWNREYRLQGQTDIPLNEDGREMARKVSEDYKDVRIDYIFSSPLKRAYETASIVKGDRELEVVTDDRLKEMSFGEYEGTTKDDREPGCSIAIYFEAPNHYKADRGAEELDSLISRAGNFLEEVIFPLAKEHPDAGVLISGHGALNKALMLNLRKAEKKDFWGGHVQRNCDIVSFDI